MIFKVENATYKLIRRRFPVSLSYFPHHHFVFICMSRLSMKNKFYFVYICDDDEAMYVLVKELMMSKVFLTHACIASSVLIWMRFFHFNVFIHIMMKYNGSPLKKKEIGNFRYEWTHLCLTDEIN